METIIYLKTTKIPKSIFLNAKAAFATLNGDAANKENQKKKKKKNRKINKKDQKAAKRLRKIIK